MPLQTQSIEIIGRRETRNYLGLQKSVGLKHGDISLKWLVDVRRDGHITNTNGH